MVNKQNFIIFYFFVFFILYFFKFNYNINNFIPLQITDNYKSMLNYGICDAQNFERDAISLLYRYLPQSADLLDSKRPFLSCIDFFNFITSEDFSKKMEEEFKLLTSEQQEICLMAIKFLNDLVTLYGNFFQEANKKKLFKKNNCCDS